MAEQEVPKIFRKIIQQYVFRDAGCGLPLYQNLRGKELTGPEKDFIAQEAYYNARYGSGVPAGGQNLRLRIDPLPDEVMAVPGAFGCTRKRVVSLASRIAKRFVLV